MSFFHRNLSYCKPKYIKRDPLELNGNTWNTGVMILEMKTSGKVQGQLSSFFFSFFLSSIDEAVVFLVALTQTHVRT